jgi:hypothetical protein
MPRRFLDNGAGLLRWSSATYVADFCGSVESYRDINVSERGSKLCFLPIGLFAWRNARSRLWGLLAVCVYVQSTMGTDVFC